MKINPDKRLWAAVFVFLAVFVWWMMGTDIQHIEDSNGPDDHSLTTITTENIVKMNTGALGGPNKSKGLLTGSAIKFYADKFTGVSEILYDNFIFPSDFTLHLTNYSIKEGNFELVIVHNEEIVATLEPGMFVDYELHDVTGTVSLRIVGESAAFEFYITQSDYDWHSHAE